MEQRSKPYHHGDLYNELLRIATKYGKRGGPSAVTIRAVTREADVSPTSAYRHFKNQGELQHAVAKAAISELVRRTQGALDSFGAGTTTASQALHDAAWAYFNFSCEEPNFFRCMLNIADTTFATAFSATLSNAEALSPAELANRHQLPHSHVEAILAYRSAMTAYASEAGTALSEERLLHNTISAWSTLHGFTHLCLESHLSTLEESTQLQLADHVFATVHKALLD
ncbi:TetR/AcrR family transcriptional regulator [Corynebacterium sp. 32222D000AT]|uniref:TetR/AcrR family transcriptional regulator n=1 Tax=unclassified Corynebacterium TaxID=2624378 RepID=UPI002A9D6862|nr:TetR/AcrR family transcriptional regulator [Mycobacteriaceae bacterium]MDY5828477.1 TetR/AcrR family transcriptional regulator [Corynebacterium sp.]